MGASHRQDMSALQHMLGQPLRAAGVGQASVQNRFHQREFRAAVIQAGTADHIAHHIHIGFQSQLIGRKALDQLNAQGPQLVAHGRVDPGIATCDFVSRFTRQGGQSSHEGAANTQNMNVHGHGF